MMGQVELNQQTFRSPGLLPIAVLLLATAVTAAVAKADGDGDRVVKRFDFTQQVSGDAVSWLKEQGFEFKLNAEQLNPHFENNRLMLETSGQNAGLIAKKVNITGVDRVRITWGVIKYPEGADWSSGVYRVPIAVMITFGNKTIDSGSLLVPDAPYFIGLFLGEHEQEGKAYKAQYYRKGGRYFCQPCSPEPGETVTTVFDFDEAIKQNFDISPPLPITSVGIQMNTNDIQGGARAFVKKIEFLSDQDTYNAAGVADAQKPEQ